VKGSIFCLLRWSFSIVYVYKRRKGQTMRPLYRKSINRTKLQLYNFAKSFDPFIGIL